MYLNKITLIGFIGSDAERRAANLRRQREWVGRATTALATCRFADLPAFPSGP